jgi:hypothetical protein
MSNLRDKLIALRGQLFAELEQGETVDLGLIHALADVISVLSAMDTTPEKEGRSTAPMK